MSEGLLFEWLSNELEEATSMSRLAARGTVRLVLKESGLEPETLTKEELPRIMAPETLGQALKNRGIDDAEAICQGLLNRLQATAAFDDSGDRDDNESPEDIFKRLGWS